MKRHAAPLVLIVAVFVVVAASLERSRSFRAHAQLTPSNITAFVGVTVVPMDSPHALPDQIVLVQGDRILEIGSSDAVHAPVQAKRIDAHGLFLLPGLADMHVHLLEGEAYFPFFLANGVTTIRHMATPPDVRGLRDQVKSGALIGPTIYTAGPILDGSPPVWKSSDVASTAEEARRAIEKQKNAG